MASSEPKKPDIHKLAKQGNVAELLQRLQVRGEGAVKDVNERDASGLTPLQHAVLNSRPFVVKLLLFRADEFNKEVGIPDHTVKDDCGETLAHYAAKASRGKTHNAPEYRAQRKSDGSSTSSNPDAEDQARNAENVLSGTLNAAARNAPPEVTQSSSSPTPLPGPGLGESQECMELLIKKDKEANQGEVEIIYVRDKVNLQTPLHYAVVYGSRSCASVILKADNHKLIHMKDKNGMTPLHLAVTHREIDIARDLIEEGARVTNVTDDKHNNLVHMKDNDGMTPLHLAVTQRKIGIARVLIEEGARVTNVTDDKHNNLVHMKDKDEMTPLHLAVTKGEIGIARVLIAEGAKVTDVTDDKHPNLVHMKDKNGMTPLHLAVTHSKIDIARDLIEEDARVTNVTDDKHNNLVHMKDKDEMTPLHLAVTKGEIDIARFLIAEGAKVTNVTDDKHPNLVHMKDKNGMTPLHLAVTHSKIDIARDLIEEDARVTNVTDDKHNSLVHMKEHDGMTPLHLAVTKGEIDIARFLIAEGAKVTNVTDDKHPNLVHMKDNDGMTPLHLAVAHSKIGIARVLIEEGAKVTNVTDDKHNNLVHMKDNNGMTPLHLAVTHSEIAIARVLIKEGARMKDNNGMTPLHLAVTKGEKGIARVLIEEGAKVTNVTDDKHHNLVHMKDNNGMTPLHLAVTQRKIDIARVLIEEGAKVTNVTDDKHNNLVHMKDKNGMTPLHLAVTKGEIDIARFLIAEGAKVTNVTDDKHPNLVHMKDNHGMTPLHLAVTHSEIDIARVLIEEGARVTNVTDDKHHNLVHMKDNNGMTPLHLAVTHSEKDIASVLIKEGARMKDKNGMTPLHLAVIHSEIDIASVLIKEDAKVTNVSGDKHHNLVHMKDNHEMTPLHLAATYNEIDIARDLIKADASVTDVDNTNSTPLHYVCATGNIRMVNDILDTYGDDQQAKEKKRHFLSTKDNGGNTCLHIGAEYGHYQVVKKLLESGASKSEGRRDTMFPLHLAVISGNKEIVVKLLKHPGCSLPNRQAHSTPLHMAAQHNRVEIAELLLKDINQVDMTDRDGNTPLHIAAQYGHPKMVVLLMKAGADIQSRNDRGRIPLHWAAANNNKTALEEILEPKKSGKEEKTEDKTVKKQEQTSKGCDYVKTEDKTLKEREQTSKPCDNVKLDTKANHFKKNSVAPTTTEPEDQVEMLRRYKQTIVNTMDNDGNTPLHLAAANGHEAIVKCLLKQHHAEYDRKNDKETTALHLAASNGKNECVNVIVELHSNSVFAEDSNCNTPLHLAAKEGHKDTVDILIAKGANIHQINLHKKTPIDLASEFCQLDVCKQLLNLEAQAWLEKGYVSSLHLACAKGHLKVVKLLLKTVDDVNFKDTKGLNCLDIAIRNGHKEIARYIIQSDFWLQAMRNAVPHRKGSKKIDTPMRRMIREMPDVAYEVLDKCCTDVTKKPKNDTEKPKKKFKYNYEFIDDLMTKDNWSLGRTATEGGKSKTTRHAEYAAYTSNSRVLKNNHPLKIMVKHERTRLLQHKLVSSLVKFKWFSFGAFYYLFTFFIHVFFLILLTRHVAVTRPPHTYSSADAKNIMNDNCGAVENAWLPAEKVLMYILMVIGAVFEIIQVINMKFVYFTVFENYVQWIVYIFSFLFLLDFNYCTIKTSYRQDWQWSVGAFALFFIWVDLVLYLKAFTSLGLYVIMFQLVCWTFCKVFIVFFSLILAFAMGFFTLLQNQVAFRDIPNSILKTAVMFLGEIDYNDLFNGGVNDITVVDTTNLLYPIATSVLFSSFITIASIVLMNLLVGLAVDDIKGILHKAVFKRCKMHIALVLDVEKVLFESIRRQFYIKRDIKNIRTHDDADGDDDDDRGWKKGWNFVLGLPMWWWNQTVERDETADQLDIIRDIARRQQQSEEKMEEIKEKIDERLEKMEKQMTEEIKEKTEEIKKLVEIKKKTKGLKKKIDKKLEKMEKQMDRLLEMQAQNGNNTAAN